MYNETEVTEKVIRLSVDGAVATIKISGTAMKHIAVLLYTILSEKNKSRGKIKLMSMIKAGKGLSVFSLPTDRLKEFATEVRRYGITYCALKDKNKSADSPIEIMYKNEDSTRLARIIEKLELGQVDISNLSVEVEKESEHSFRSEVNAEKTHPQKPQSELHSQGQKKGDRKHIKSVKEEIKMIRELRKSTESKSASVKIPKIEKAR